MGVFKSFTTILPDLMVEGANRPTITFVPGDNSDTIKRFLSPLPTETLVLLGESSWPMEVILRVWVERLNGVPNAVTASGPDRGFISDYERFRRLAGLFQYAQDHQLATIRSESRDRQVSGPLPAGTVTAAAVVEAAKDGMEYRPYQDGQSWVLLRKERKMVLRVNPTALESPELEEIIRLLNLLPGQLSYDVTVAPGVVPDPLLFPQPPSTGLLISPRSSAQVYFYLANGVEVPCEHLQCGLVKPTSNAEGNPMDGRELTRGLFEVHACKGHKPPPTAYVAIKNRGYWYYIDDRDQASKSTLALVLQLSRLDFGIQKAAAMPLLTLPIGP
jgi:hypothetical protein